MTRTLFRGKCDGLKCDAGYVFLTTLLILASIAGFFGIIVSAEKVESRRVEKTMRSFYERLEQNNLKIQEEAKNEIA